jgi:hypothetical protein
MHGNTWLCTITTASFRVLYLCAEGAFLLHQKELQRNLAAVADDIGSGLVRGHTFRDRENGVRLIFDCYLREKE